MSFDSVDEVLKIKPVVELKEDHGNHVYKTDFRGHLQLVNITDDVPNQRVDIKNNNSGQTKQLARVKSSQMLSEEDPQIIAPWQVESTKSCGNYVYSLQERIPDESMNNKINIKEELFDGQSVDCAYGHSLPEIYESSSDSTWEQQGDNSNHSGKSNNLLMNHNLVILTQAEKKRMYRLKIKEENPAMWSSIKEREAARKRELREKRRQVIYEMQKTMEMAAHPNFPEEQQMYLEALKDRYPDIWNQLTKVLPETERRNQQLFIERTTKSNRTILPKPARMYKDVIEAQKKRLYRQRIKEQRPEMYQRQKARDSYARSLQRLLAKANKPSGKMNYYTERHYTEDMEMCNPHLNIYQDKESQFVSSMHSKDKITNGSVMTHREIVKPAFNSTLFSSPATKAPLHSNAVSDSSKSNSSNACDNEHLKNNDTSELSSNSCDNKESPPNPTNTSGSTASTTQSDVLWYWNDLTINSTIESNQVKAEAAFWPPKPGPQALTEEERLQKVERERLYLKEKRKRYRLAMTPERRIEFLKMERERLKQYRKKKKTEGVLDYT